MGVMLYRSGNTHTIRGISCEMEVFPVEMLQSQLDRGWKVDPMDTIQYPETTEPPEPPEPPGESGTGFNFDTMSNKKIRNTAKMMGVKNWDTARIGTLKMELINDYS